MVNIEQGIHIVRENSDAYISENSDKFGQLMAFYMKNSTSLSTAQLNVLMAVIQNAIKKQIIMVKEYADELDFSNPNGYKFDKEFENLEAFYVTVPFKNTNSASEKMSGLTVSFDSEFNIKEYAEIQVTESRKMLKSTLYINGEYIGTTTIPQKSKQEVNNENIQTMGYIDDVNACL